jgi:hypothetical protein
VADASHSRAQLEKVPIGVEHSRDPVGSGLGSDRLPRAHIAVKDYKRVAVTEGGHEACTTPVMTIGPPSYAFYIGKEAHLPSQAFEAARETYEARRLREKGLVGQFPTRLEGGIWRFTHAE